MKKQIHIIYSGSVQGVGFRFTAERIANDLGLRGWVKNIQSGKVEVVAEGEEAKLKEFLEKVDKYFSRYIEAFNIDWSDYKGEFKDFGIRF